MSYHRSDECLRECEHGRHDPQTGRFVPFEVITTVTQDKRGFYCYDVGLFQGGEFVLTDTVYEGVGPSDVEEDLILCRCCQHSFEDLTEGA